MRQSCGDGESKIQMRFCSLSNWQEFSGSQNYPGKHGDFLHAPFLSWADLYVVYVVVSSHTHVITLLSVFVLEISTSILLEKNKSLKEIMLELSSIHLPAPFLVCPILPFLRPLEVSCLGVSCCNQT